jgi:uncharacterized damage-inducible protein DinB
MNTMLEPVLNEFREEAAITRRVLERVPADKLSWKPHAKSMSLGQLALHVAEVPARLATMLQGEQAEAKRTDFGSAQPKSTNEITTAFEQSTRTAENFLSSVSEKAALENFRLSVNGKTAFDVPRVEWIRKVMLNHVYHHRGQLSVYLRLLDVPLPFIYGPSADENPFA